MIENNTREQEIDEASVDWFYHKAGFFRLG